MSLEEIIHRLGENSIENDHMLLKLCEAIIAHTTEMDLNIRSMQQQIILQQKQVLELGEHLATLVEIVSSGRKVH